MRNLLYIFVLVGVVLIIYANSIENKYLLTLGLISLMVGLFKINQNLTSNQKKEALDIKTEKEEGKNIKDE